MENCEDSTEDTKYIVPSANHSPAFVQSANHSQAFESIHKIYQNIANSEESDEDTSSETGRLLGKRVGAGAGGRQAKRAKGCPRGSGRPLSSPRGRGRPLGSSRLVDEDSYRCDTCWKEFNCRKTWNNHNGRMTRRVVCPAPDCGELVGERKEYVRHWLSRHGAAGPLADTQLLKVEPRYCDPVWADRTTRPDVSTLQVVADVTFNSN